MKRYLAIDIGASSGRHVIGWVENGKVMTKEVYRFANGVEATDDGHLVWNINRLFNEIKTGIKVAFSQFAEIESLAIDSWGVDYVLMKNEATILPCYSYRDSRTDLSVYHVQGVVGNEYLYEKTGIQFQPFNTVYQLANDKVCGRLKDVTDFLMIPEYLNYKLTGKRIKEYTNATTTGFVNVKTKQFDQEVISALHLPYELFPTLHFAGETVGELLPEIVSEVGGNTVVKLCASHDTASAFEAVDNQPNSILISSGTWSLIGTKLCKPLTTDEARKANFTNEGGVGYIRFLKNVTGMWINVQLQKEFDREFPEMQQIATHSTFKGIYDVNNKVLAMPCENYSRKIVDWFKTRGETVPETEADLYLATYRSLAYAYKNAISEIECLTAKHYDTVYIIGGGAKNYVVNELTAEMTNKKVIPMPIEATAIGNLKVQMR